MAETKDATWFVPVCDAVMAKVQHWLNAYERGEESADRKFVTMNGRIVDRVTMYAHKLLLKPLEVDHLVRLLNALAEHQELTADFRKVRAGMMRGRLHPGGFYEVTLNFYKQDVAEILDVLKRAKSGKLKTLDQLVKERTDEGKGVFEV